MIRANGWAILVPDRLLIECLPLGGKDGFVGMEIQRRTGFAPWAGGASNETWTDETYTAFFRRCRSGNMLARPVDESWKKSYGEMLRQMYRRFAFDRVSGRANVRYSSAPVSDALADAIEALVSLPVEVTVTTRSKWPRNVRPQIEAPVEHWWPIFYGFEQDATMQTNGGATVMAKRFISNFTTKHQTDAHATVEIDVDVYRTLAHLRKPGEAPVKRVHAVLEYDVVELIDDVMEPMQSAEADAAMAAIVASIRRSSLDLDHRMAEKLPAGVAFGLSYELRASGVPVENGFIRCVGGAVGWTMGSISNPDKAPPRENWDPKAVWTLNLKTDPAWSLYSIAATKYWKGEVTVPVTFVP